MRDFSVSYDNQVLLGMISQCGPLPAASKKDLSFLFSLAQGEDISGHSVEKRVYWFVLKIARVFPVFTGRVGIGWCTLL